MGNKVRDFRKRMKMTQSELSKKSGVSRGTICAIESGKAKSTTSRVLIAIANALGTTVESIFFGNTV